MLASLLAMGVTLPSYAAEGFQLVEQQIEAGLLYNFLKYTEWPTGRTAKANAPIIVCLFGGDPFAGNLQPMAGRTVNQQVIEIRSPRTIQETQVCSLLFIHSVEKPRWPELRMALRARSVLTVSDFEGFAESGGMIEFTKIDNRIGAKINMAAVTAAHLQVEDRLLKLVTPVRSGADGR
jgi:hypothetical protein